MTLYLNPPMSLVSPIWLSLSGEANYFRSTYIDGFLDVSASKGVLLRSDVSFGGRLSFPTLTTVSPNSTAATSSTWSNNGINWTSSASNNLGGFGGYDSFRAFNNVIGSSHANSSQNTSTTTTPTSFSTTLYGSNGTAEVSAASSFSQNGEWLQIQSSVPTTMKDFKLVSGGNPQQVPRIFYIAGSTNGTIWYPLGKYTLSAGNTVKDGNVSGTITISTSNQSATDYSSTGYSFAANAYSYFRFITLNTYASSNGHVEIGEWSINFTPSSATSAITLAPSTTVFNQLDLTGGLSVSAVSSFTSNVGIGTTNPAATLDVNGTIGFSYSSLPTFTSNHIGYTYNVTSTSTSFNASSQTQILAQVVPTGVWLINTFFQCTTGNTNGNAACFSFTNTNVNGTVINDGFNAYLNNSGYSMNYNFVYSGTGTNIVWRGQYGSGSGYIGVSRMSLTRIA